MKIPDWGLSLLNLFGVMAGILTFLMTIGALMRFRVPIRPWTLIAIMFYFPYTILMNVSIIVGVIYYRITKERFFKAK